jgi:hypothetical protein
MQKMRDTLSEGQYTYVFGGRTYSVEEVEHDMNRRLERYKNVEREIEAKQKLLEAKQKTLSAATQKIGQYQHQRDMLLEKAESLQTELKLVELAQAGGNFQFDDSKLAQARQLAQDLEKRIRTMQKLIDGQRHIDDEIPVEADSRSVAQKFDEYFGQGPAVAAN